jgi:hypothetical protein
MGLEFSLHDGCRLNGDSPLWQIGGYLPQNAGNGNSMDHFTIVNKSGE